MHCRNFRSTLEQGRTSTWRLPRFSALVMVLRAFARTFISMVSLYVLNRKGKTTGRKEIMKMNGVEESQSRGIKA